MEYVKQQKKSQQKTDIRPKRTGVSQQIKREYSEKQERLGMLAYIQENKVNLKTKQGAQSYSTTEARIDKAHCTRGKCFNS